MKKLVAVLATATLTLAVGPVARAAIVPIAPAAEQPVRFDPRLDAHLDANPVDAVAFVHGRNIDAAETAVRAAGLDIIDTYDRIGVVAVAGTAPAIRSLTVAEGITYLEAVQEVTFDLQTSVIATRAAQALEAFEAPEGGSYDGSGVGIGIIDSGLDGTHPMFQVDGKSKVVRNIKSLCQGNQADCILPETQEHRDMFFVDAPTNDTDTLAANGHGTHVASTAAGVAVETSDGRKLTGIAPGAKLVGISVYGPRSYSIASGLNWALDHHLAPCGPDVPAADCPPLRVVSLSLSAPRGDYDPEGTIAKLQDALVADGVNVVWSAGNFGTPDLVTGEYEDPKVESQVHQWKQSPTPGVITAASYFDGNTGTREGVISGFSSKGRIGDVATYPDLAAPGEDITAACRAWLPICSTGLDGIPDPDYNTISGTSMAAPHIAGAVARLLDADPTLTPGQIEDILEDTAYKFTSGSAYEPDLADRNDDNTTSNDKGHGLLDLTAAVARALNATDPGVVDPCSVAGPLVTDARGDAIAFIGIATPLPSESSLDIVRSDISWNATTETASFAIEVDDLPETPGANSSGTGEYFDYEFTYAGEEMYLTANRTLDGGETFTLGQFRQTRTTLARGLAGSFDAATDTITIHLSNADLARVTLLALPPMKSGDQIGGIEITARRDILVFVPDADVAAGKCPYFIP